MAGDNNKDAISPVASAFFASVNNYFLAADGSSLLNDPPQFLSGFSLVQGSSKRKQFTWCQVHPGARIFLLLS